MFEQCPTFTYLGLRSILMLCEQAKIGECGVLVEYLLKTDDGVTHEGLPPFTI